MADVCAYSAHEFAPLPTSYLYYDSSDSSDELEARAMQSVRRNKSAARRARRADEAAARASAIARRERASCGMSAVTAPVDAAPGDATAAALTAATRTTSAGSPAALLATSAPSTAASSAAGVAAHAVSKPVRPLCTEDIMHRIKHDAPRFKAEEFNIGYEDRFLGIQVLAFNEFKTLKEDLVDGIPLHRIRFFEHVPTGARFTTQGKYREVEVWVAARVAEEEASPSVE